MRPRQTGAVGLLCASLLLAACARSGKATYRLAFDVPAADIREELMWSSLRLMEFTAKQLGTELANKEVTVGSGTTTITIKLREPRLIADMTATMTQPFTLRFLRQLEEGETGSGAVTVKDQGTFIETGIGEDDVFWAEAAEDKANGKAAVRLLFSKEGQVHIDRILRDNRGKTIGLFVQGKLVGLLRADAIKDDVVLRGIPTGDLARSFADRVNVGLHVTFTLAP